MSFSDEFNNLDWDQLKDEVYGKTSVDVEKALKKKGKRTLDDFKALVSPAAEAYLGSMAELSSQLTAKRFGHVVQMYIPLYLSNECQNICTYCGFSQDNAMPRRTLSDAEILKEVEVIKSMGFDHVLLVTGEAQRTVGVEYIQNAIEVVRPHFANVSIEVQPLEEDEYVQLKSSGLHSVLVYQETYHQAEYKKHHPKGKKSNFNYRLETPDRIGASGLHKVGLGVLIGLEDWRVDSVFCASHLSYLEKKYWQTRYSLSFPRLRPFSGGLDPKVDMSDRELVQLICAYRIFNEELELSVSTRETKVFRDNIIKIGINSMSAGSRTDPGGYATSKTELEQFEIDDDRSPEEIAQMLKASGYEPVWKDWDIALESHGTKSREIQ